MAEPAWVTRTGRGRELQSAPPVTHLPHRRWRAGGDMYALCGKRLEGPVRGGAPFDAEDPHGCRECAKRQERQETPPPPGSSPTFWPTGDEEE